MNWLDEVRWNADGLVPAVAQETTSARVLTLAWMNRDALSATHASGLAHYWSRSRARLWQKGESSGHVQRVCEIRLDCDRDAILLVVEQAGGIACHTGHERCFYRRLDSGRWRDVEPVLKDPESIYGRKGAPDGGRPPDAPIVATHTGGTLAVVEATIASRLAGDPKTSYVASLVAGGSDAILKKVGEEATETVLAAKGGDRAAITHEVADLWFHCLVLLAHHGLSHTDVLGELDRRHGTSGLTEKASRGR